MADETNDQRWTWLALGLSVAGVISLVGLLFYLIRRATSEQQPMMRSARPSIDVEEHRMAIANYQARITQLERLFGARNDRLQIEASTQPIDATLNTPDDSLLAQQPMMHTYALTPLSDPNQEPVRLAQASNTAYDVVLSVVGPTGAYAAFAMDPGELRNSGVFPTGNTIILPTCETRRIRLLPHQAIYAKGQPKNPADTVYATATANEAGSRIYS